MGVSSKTRCGRFVNSGVKLNKKYGAAPECKGGLDRKPPIKPSDQRHRPARSPRAKIRERPKGLELGSSRWKASALAAEPLRLRHTVCIRDDDDHKLSSNIATVSVEFWEHDLSSPASEKEQKSGRWSARADATKTLLQSFPMLKQVLANISYYSDQKAECHQQAFGLLSTMIKLETAIMITLWDQILQRFQISAFLHSYGQDLNTACALYESLQGYIQALRSTFSDMEQNGKTLTGCEEYKCQIRREHKRNRAYDHFKGSSCIETIDSFRNKLEFKTHAFIKLQPLVHTGFDTSCRKLAQSTPYTAAAYDQCAINIGIIMHKTVESSLQVIEANFSGGSSSVPLVIQIPPSLPQVVMVTERKWIRRALPQKACSPRFCFPRIMIIDDYDSPFLVTSNFSETLLKFYFQDILNQVNYIKGTTHRFLQEFPEKAYFMGDLIVDLHETELQFRVGRSAYSNQVCRQTASKPQPFATWLSSISSSARRGLVACGSQVVATSSGRSTSRLVSSRAKNSDFDTQSTKEYRSETATYTANSSRTASKMAPLANNVLERCLTFQISNYLRRKQAVFIRSGMVVSPSFCRCICFATVFVCVVFVVSPNQLLFIHLFHCVNFQEGNLARSYCRFVVTALNLARSKNFYLVRRDTLLPLVHAVFDTSGRTVSNLSPSTVTADNQYAVDIGIFVHMTVVSSLQIIAVAPLALTLLRRGARTRQEVGRRLTNDCRGRLGEVRIVFSSSPRAALAMPQSRAPNGRDTCREINVEWWGYRFFAPKWVEGVERDDHNNSLVVLQEGGKTSEAHPFSANRMLTREWVDLAARLRVVGIHSVSLGCAMVTGSYCVHRKRTVVTKHQLTLQQFTTRHCRPVVKSFREVRVPLAITLAPEHIMAAVTFPAIIHEARSEPFAANPRVGRWTSKKPVTPFRHSSSVHLSTPWPVTCELQGETVRIPTTHKRAARDITHVLWRQLPSCVLVVEVETSEQQCTA
ncbi:hypothetical protein PR048_029302 [Dryococelus australis]|uniref:Uncharacterized protein n=1 Tax=Dryococelus australis TaxID=614101 RepID=A0ABQ9GFH7_9NEOP|nr:hypothetical protein PR048_029302 [Dryococelus australis]